MNNDTIPVTDTEWSRYIAWKHANRINELSKKKNKNNSEILEAHRVKNQQENSTIKTEQSNQYAGLQNQINLVKNQTLKLQSQINELIVNMEIRDKLIKAQEKQIQYIQQTNYEMYLTYISSIQQIVDLIHNSNNEIKDNVILKPNNELIEGVLKKLETTLQKQGKWEPLFPDLNHLHRQNSENSRTSND